MKELIRDVQTDKLLERSGPQSRKSRPLVVRACAPVIAAALFLPLAAQPAGATTVASEPLSVAATALPGLTAADSGAKQCENKAPTGSGRQLLKPGSITKSSMGPSTTPR